MILKWYIFSHPCLKDRTLCSVFSYFFYPAKVRVWVKLTFDCFFWTLQSISGYWHISKIEILQYISRHFTSVTVFQSWKIMTSPVAHNVLKFCPRPDYLWRGAPAGWRVVWGTRLPACGGDFCWGPAVPEMTSQTEPALLAALCCSPADVAPADAADSNKREGRKMWNVEG